ncbi:MAG: YfcE family phosphodiesterase [Patescibacteria group bacterium]|nr:YfcE family phosphodiesterase [Patescibacteria group bacterium]MBU0879199.1 YfcE family phosphodiesterase [Patescibacteria group bacterium]MBU0880457.1 YfcE family phosphodiesterase [Patescibacteria group bacterium]MBU0897525.1 YfcE family phosphodiesterase [Patescibacteria group bacterium]MBU1783545.1 YfcE family phosphodiesterase [Patescibacteria group bacterium]
MFVVIISDIHDNLTNLKKSLSWCKENQVERLICCGDVCNSDTLKYLADNFAGTIDLVLGNMELYEEKEISRYKNINYLGLFGIINLAGKKIGICHKPELIAKVKEFGHCDLIFYGHTHQPWIREEEGVLIANPGTLGGVFFKASLAIWNSQTGGLELKILELMNNGLIEN